MKKQITGASGKPLTVTCATRLAIVDYERVKNVAERRNVSVSALLQGWISEKLSANEAVTNAAS